MIIVKDLSRFGRNYILYGQHLDYIFPYYGIRFIAIQDNVDTENRDNGGMDMMPIMNVFNEWHAANTSKKIRAVLKANAKDGKYHPRKAPYGYVKGTDKKRTPVIDEEAAKVVKRIFEMRSQGMSPYKIADELNEEGISSPSKYCMEKYGIVGRKENFGLWSVCPINSILKNPTYLGNMAQQRYSSISYKNHKRYICDKSEWIVVENTHEAIITRELWDKVREVEKSVSQGKRTKHGYTHPLSGFLYCADCGGKMKLNYIKRKGELEYNFNCGNHVRLGKAYCFSHYISAKILEDIVITDIRDKARMVSFDEDVVRKQYLERSAELTENAGNSAKRELQTKKARAAELKKLIEMAYEDRMKGKLPEDICLEFIEKYSSEEKSLNTEIAKLEQQISEAKQTEIDVDEFLTKIKRYVEAPELNREMCYELIDRIVVGGHPKVTGTDRVIDIVYKVDINSIR